MSSSSNSDHLTNLVQHRNLTLGLTLSAKQAVTFTFHLKYEFLIIPSTIYRNSKVTLFLILKK